MRSRQLGPEAAETQQRLRSQQKQVSERIQQLEEQIQALRKLVLTARRGAQPLKYGPRSPCAVLRAAADADSPARWSSRAPTLDTISRSIRHITMAINQRMYEIDDLSLRFDMTQISSPAAKRRAPAAITAAPAALAALAELPAPPTSSPLKDVLARPAVQEKVASLAARALNDERKLVEVRSLLLRARKEPIKTTVAPTRASAVLGYRDPKAVDPAPPASAPSFGFSSSLATPRKFTPVDGPKAASRPPAQSPLTMGSLATPPHHKFGAPSSFEAAKPPTSKLAQPPLNFSSFNAPPPTAFSTLDSAAFEPQSPSDDHDSGSGSRRRGKASSHASAPKFVAPKAPAPATSSFSFGPPPPLPKSNFAPPSSSSPSLFSFAGASPTAKPSPFGQPSYVARLSEPPDLDADAPFLRAPRPRRRTKPAASTFSGFTGFGAPAKKEEPPAPEEDEGEAEDDDDEEDYGEEDEDEDGEYVYDWKKGEGDDGEDEEEEASEEGYDG